MKKNYKPKQLNEKERRKLHKKFPKIKKGN